MTLLFRVVRALTLVACVTGAVPTRALAQPPTPPPVAQDEFVPISELPEEDQLPAAPLLVAAYTVAWAAILIYLWMLWRRLGRVEQELAQARRAASSR